MLTVCIPTLLGDQALASTSTVQTCPLRELRELSGDFQPRINARHPNLALSALHPCLLALRQMGWHPKVDLTQQACACRSAQHLRGDWLSRVVQEGDCSRPRSEQGQEAATYPCCPCQVPRPLAMKKESIQTRKRKPKNPAKIKGSSGKQEAGGVTPRPPSLSLTQPLMDVLSLAGRGAHGQMWGGFSDV